VERSDLDEELTREDIIAEFVDQQSDVRVLIANPAACAESISLHKACTHAIYYDLSYNCAQYVQSLDRIHRVGGSETRPSHYYFLQCADTIDREILANVRRKADNMSRVIDQDYPVYALDMFEEDDELEAYERLFGAAKQRV
jgi:SNF2 family DNA or RNA helicase